jgi:hypothetical protein
MTLTIDQTLAFRLRHVISDPKPCYLPSPLYGLVKVAKLLFIIDRSLKLCISFRLGGYNGEQEGSSRSS